MPRHHEYSQHFLRSPKLVAMLVGHTNLKKSDTVLDIGAGSGVITSVLARRVQKVIANENETSAVAKLRRNVEELDNITIVEGDFMTIELPDEPYKVFANIPFSLSSQVVEKLIKAKNPPEAIYLIVQKQFANKLLPDNDGFSSQAGMILGVEWRARVRFRLKKHDFTPPPAVDTVLLELMPRAELLIEPRQLSAYETFVRQNFTDPKLFVRFGFTPEIKPSHLKLADWVRLFREQKS